MRNPLIRPVEATANRGDFRKGAAPSRLPLILAAALCALTFANLREALAVTVSLNTAALSGVNGRLEFDLFDGDFVLGNNTVTISNLVSDGTLLNVDCSVGCTGGPPYTLDDGFGFGQLLRDLNLGTFANFDLAFSTNFVSDGTNAPDRLAVFLLDPGTNFTLVDTNLDLNDAVPVQDALVVIDLVNGGRIQLATITNPRIAAVVVPEPGVVSMLVLGLVLLTAGRFARSSVSLS